LKPIPINDYRANDPFHAFYKVKEIKAITNIKFLLVGIDKHLDWVIIIQLIIPKLSSACYLSFVIMHTLKMTYFIHFHLLMKYGNVFLCNSTVISLSVTEVNCECYDQNPEGHVNLLSKY
jgi:hypothetical protein